MSNGLAATTGTDNVVRVWQLDTREVVLELPLNSRISNVEFLDESHVLAVGLDGEVLVFTLDSDELKSIARQRLTRGFTHEECTIYNINPYPALEEMRAGS